MPTNVKHVQHMSYSEGGGFKFDDQPIPIEWKKLFRAAGVKRKDLEDKVTAKRTAPLGPSALPELHPSPGPSPYPELNPSPGPSPRPSPGPSLTLT